jgi:pilus assembly protein CpaB
VAQRIGQLSLSLRSLADHGAELDRAIASGEVQVPQTDDPAAERRMLLAIANQPIDTNSTYTVGGDVSRFQRRTVGAPTRAAAATPPPAQIIIRESGSSGSRDASPPAAPAATAAPVGPTVRIARGNDVTVVPVGGR